MKQLLAVVVLAFTFGSVAMAGEPATETKKVCIKTTDAKTGKEVEKCKVMKKHEKHEGTAVEGASKDKK